MNFIDHKYIGDRYLDYGNEKTTYNPKNPTECLICIESEQGNFSKYARNMAQKEAHNPANMFAEENANKEKTIDYLDYYMMFYRMEYTKSYNNLIEKYSQEYYNKLLDKYYNNQRVICRYHQESILYHYENKHKKCSNLEQLCKICYGNECKCQMCSDILPRCKCELSL